tara:strand:- start:4311 stop:5114 length:804 start_codon:yes stop_codon:yes gene_type:complete
MSFAEVDDPVRTEEVIYQQLKERAPQIETDYVYVALPLAFLLNRAGIAQTQMVINSVCERNKGQRLVFVCQHIQVNQLNFQGHLVFSPHATSLDSYVPLPHYSCNYDEAYIKPWNEREIVFSFMGSYITHPVRRRIHEHLSVRDDCYVADTGMWHFEGSEEKQIQNRQRYIELLGNTKYSLCPRGTGPSSIRIWESMAMGAAPVIISDSLQMPLEMHVPENTWLRLPEAFDTTQLDHIEGTLEMYNNKEYKEKFSNENLYRTIVENL